RPGPFGVEAVVAHLGTPYKALTAQQLTPFRGWAHQARYGTEKSDGTLSVTFHTQHGDLCPHSSAYWCLAVPNCPYVSAAKRWKSQASTNFRKEATQLFASIRVLCASMRCGLLSGLPIKRPKRPQSLSAPCGALSSGSFPTPNSERSRRQAWDRRSSG